MRARTGQHRALCLVLLTVFLLAFWLPARPVEALVATQKVAPALLEQMAADPLKPLAVIVEMAPLGAPFPTRPNERLAQQALDLLRLYGQPVGALPLVNAAAGFANAAGITAMSLLPSVVYIHDDAVVGPRPGSAAPGTAAPGQLSAVYPRVVGADRLWAAGTTGKGVTVAVLDSGIAPDPDLVQPVNRLLATVNFAGERGVLPDPGGHGTHVAGIIAGNGTRSGGQYMGIAPQANVIDVRVLDRNGNGRVSSVVRGIEWVLAHQVQYNIRVINLSFGAPPRTPYRLDPLSAAIEIAWHRGLVVVAAAGNGGPNRGTVETPGIDPYLITVGATDDLGTLSVADDVLAWFSAWGTPAGSTPRPDLVAPGRRIVSLRVPGSALDRLFPDRVVTAKNGATYFRLTGTSMATAVVSGAVALLLERRPDLTPDQVKALLTGTTQPYGQQGAPAPPDPAADGSGLLDVYAAAAAPARGSLQGWRAADGLARALYPILYGSRLVWEDPSYQGINWNSLSWSVLRWDALAWDNLAWDAVDWSNLAWDNLAWDNLAWDNLAWDKAGWDNLAWDSLALD